jgi:uncharacterized protein YbcI
MPRGERGGERGEVEALSGDVLAAVSRELVRIKAQHYGKGATEAKVYQCDDWLFCVLKGGLTTVERTLLERGDEDLVRQVRLRFQDQMSDTFIDAIARTTGRRVRTYHSQIMFDPDYAVEMFLLGERLPDGSEEDEGR